jgi:hypothetical protein
MLAQCGAMVLLFEFNSIPHVENIGSVSSLDADIDGNV